MKRYLALLLVFCFIFTFAACNASEGASDSSQNQDSEADSLEKVRKQLEKHEFLGVTFYLPSDFTQSNIFADVDTGRLTYTNDQGITVLINISEASFIEQYYDADIPDAKAYAQVYFDDDKAVEAFQTTMSEKFDVPYICRTGVENSVSQYGFMGFYQAGNYFATVSVYTEDEAVFKQNEEAMIHYATIASFKR